MLRRHFKSGRRAQIFIEYTIVIGVIVLIMVAMGTALKRGTQAMVKVVADEIGSQEDADQQFDDTGHLESSFTTTRSTANRTISEFIGDTTYGFDEAVTSSVAASINLGFTEDNR